MRSGDPLYGTLYRAYPDWRHKQMRWMQAVCALVDKPGQLLEVQKFHLYCFQGKPWIF